MKLKTLLIMLSGIAFADTAFASCDVQSVWLSSGNTQIADWKVNRAEIHRTALPNGFELGLKIEPVTAEKYRELMKLTKQKKAPELVKISVYDMRGVAPKLLTHTFGGANSQQGYAPRGGADGVAELGEPGIKLRLHKAACIKETDLSSLEFMFASAS